MEEKKLRTFKSDKAILVRNTFSGTIGRIYNQAIKERRDHDWVLKQKKEWIFDTENYKRLTIADRSYLNGYDTCWYNRIWYEEVVWKMFHPTEGFVTSEQISKLKLNYSDLISPLGAHFWHGIEIKYWSKCDFLNQSTESEKIQKYHEDDLKQITAKYKTIKGTAKQQFKIVFPELVEHFEQGESIK